MHGADRVPRPNGTITLHVFLDRSVLEVFVDGGLSSLAARSTHVS